MKPVIIRITSEIAAPFTIAYCTKYGIPYPGDPNFGHEVIWFGASLNNVTRAVIGLVAIPEGVYILGIFQDDTSQGMRAIMALNRWMYDLKMPLWGHIREDNPKMWNRALKDGAQIRGSTKNKELLMHWPAKRALSLL